MRVMSGHDQLARDDAPDGEPPPVVVIAQVVGLEAQRRVRVVRRAAKPAQDGREERREVGAFERGVKGGGAGARVGVDDREVELGLARAEVDEEAVDLVEHWRRARVGPVDLVQADDRGEPQLERLPQHEAGLGQRPLGGVDQEKHAVDHRQGALDLAAEVRVPGRVHDVDVHALPGDGRVLGQDGDAALALEREGVHHPVGDLLVGAEDARLAQHGVDQRRLPVVDVRDDGDVAHVGTARERQGASRSGHDLLILTGRAARVNRTWDDNGRGVWTAVAARLWSRAMTITWRLYSCDDHLDLWNLPRDLWEGRLPARLRERGR